MNVVFYITGHGFGHASRVIEVINELLLRERGVHVCIRTRAARWLFDLTVRGAFTYDEIEPDTGLVQIDSLRVHIEESVARAITFMRTFDARVRAEAAVLRTIGANLVVADMPALGIAAAKRAGIPAVAMGNFSWDWAYAGYPGTTQVVDAIATAYSGADFAIRLPMWGGFGAFEQVLDVPFVARRSTRDPEDTRHALRLPLDKRLVLPSFGGHGLTGLKETPVGSEYHVLLNLDEKQMYADGFRYEDVIRAVDVVVTKPGYGIIAECLANDTALLYTDRGQFVEYDVLVDAMPRLVRCAYINHADLFAGNWKAHLDAVLAQPPSPAKPATNGAEVIADMLLEVVGNA